MPFRPRLEPFKRYASELGTMNMLYLVMIGTFFTEDKAVKSACHYWSTGEAPAEFTWMHDKSGRRKRRGKKLATVIHECKDKQTHDLLTKGIEGKGLSPTMSAVMQRWLTIFK
jgi:hypothetical protein